MEIGSKIKELRMKNGLTQEELADRSELSKGFISQLENDVTSVSYTHLNRVGLKMSDVDVYECNEAFAAQNLSVIKEMENITGEKMNMENWNPNGGAIALDVYKRQEHDCKRSERFF